MHSSKPEVIESVFQYISMWKVLTGDWPDADLSDRPGLAMCWAGSRFPFWNAVFVTSPIADSLLVEGRLREAAAYMRAKCHRGILYLCEDHLTDAARQNLDAIVEDAGLAFRMEIIGMAGDMLPYGPTLRGESPLEFRRVTDEAALLTFGEINAQSHALGPEARCEGIAGSRFWRSTAFAFIGYENGHAVSTAAAIVNGGRLYVALVATVPHARRRGHGLATVRHALQQAHEATGVTRAVVHTPSAGLPLCARAGFQRTTRFFTYGLAAT
jgi:GNAT superfamily N-acetyltransferase